MRSQILLALAVLLTCSAIQAQDLMDYGTVHVLHEETREVAGAESFHLWLEGNLADAREECVAAADVFAANNELLGKIELRWPDYDTTAVTYTAAETGIVYRIIGHEDGSTPVWMEFEDLSIDDGFVVRHIGEEFSHKIYQSNDEKILALKQGRARQPQWLREGVSRNSEVRMDAYQQIIGLVSMIVFEIETVLGIAPGQQNPMTPVEEILRPPLLKFISCPDGTVFCDFNSAAVGNGEVLFGGKTACCTEASLEADITCQLHTGAGCCTNSNCVVTSPICFGVCACTVIGYLWGCQTTPCV